MLLLPILPPPQTWNAVREGYSPRPWNKIDSNLSIGPKVFFYRLLVVLTKLIFRVKYISHLAVALFYAAPGESGPIVQSMRSRAGRKWSKFVISSGSVFDLHERAEQASWGRWALTVHVEAGRKPAKGAHAKKIGAGEVGEVTTPKNELMVTQTSRGGNCGAEVVESFKDDHLFLFLWQVLTIFCLLIKISLCVQGRPSSTVELQFCKLWVIGSNPMDGSISLATAGFFHI